MSTIRVTVTIDQFLINQVDKMVEKNLFKNRSAAIQTAVEDEIQKVKEKSFELACSMLDKNEEQELADEWLEGDTWSI